MKGNGDYFDLGEYERPVTTSSGQARRWFHRGLLWVYGFNHEEGVVCFKKAAEVDPKCAMAYWGVAYASGPFYNLPWDWFSRPELEEVATTCYAAIQEARERCGQASPVERALIEALGRRFQSDQILSVEEYQRWDDAYAMAMRAVHASFPEDLDVIALFAEAMITRTPWKLWDIHRGVPAPGADTIEAKAVLEKGMALVEASDGPPHPGILHMYIHVMEMSPTPERALLAADRLRDRSPDNGHLQHMPAHIYTLCGFYEDSIAASEKAIAADRKYASYAGPYNFYTTSRCHDFHMMMYAAMMLGRYQPALEAAAGIVETLTADVLRVDKPHLAMTVEGYYSMRMHVLVRFGRWREIIEAPLPGDSQLYCVTTAMYHYAKGVAHAAIDDIEAARAQRTLLDVACDAIPSTRRFFNNVALDILAIGSEMLNGELEYRIGNHEAAFSHLRRAIHRDDNLHYTEPWAWMHPPRHALGALLLEQDRVVEAEQAYRADLGLDGTLGRCLQHPENVWGLHGYVECLKRLDKPAQAAMLHQRLDVALARADVRIASFCYCRRYSD